MLQRMLSSAGAVLAVMTTLNVVSLLAPQPAAAHRDPTLAVRMTGVEPELPSGMLVEVLDEERTYLGLVNPTSTAALVLDPQGKPFLQLSREGVLGDINSPYLAASRDVVERATTTANPDCCPEGRWVELSTGPRWAWPDPRLDPPLRDAVAGEARGLAAMSTDRGPLAEWEIPLRIEGQELTVAGVIERRVVGAVTTTVESAPSGLQISVVESRPPQLRLELREGTTLEVLGRDGHTFIRMGPSGALARTASADYRASRRAIGLAPETSPAWTPMAASGPNKVVWADSRLDYQNLLPDHPRREAFVLDEWAIQVIVDGQPGEIRGKSIWEPVPVPRIGAPPPPSFWASGDAMAYAGVGLLTLLLLGTIILARRRIGLQRPDSEQLG